MVAATNALVIDERAQLLIIVEVIFVDEHVICLRQRSARETGRLNVDMPTGQASGKASVLALFADSQRQLVIGHDNRGIVVLLVDEHAVDLRRRQRVGHVTSRVLVPLNHVDALVAQLLDHHAHAAALRADACAHRIKVALARSHGNLRTSTRLAGDGLDLHQAIVNLGDFDFEQTADQIGVRTRHNDGRTCLLTAHARSIRTGIANLDNEHLQALVVTIVLAVRALVALAGIALHIVMRQLGLNAIANLDDGEIGRALKHGARDQIAHATGELFIDGLAASLTHDRGNYALGVLRSNAAHVGRRHVALFELGVFARLLIRLANGNKLIHIDMAGLAVDGDASVPLEVKNMLIAFRQRRLKSIDEVELVDLAFMCQRLQSLDQFRTCHVLASFL